MIVRDFCLLPLLGQTLDLLRVLYAHLIALIVCEGEGFESVLAHGAEVGFQPEIDDLFVLLAAALRPVIVH